MSRDLPSASRERLDRAVALSHAGEHAAARDALLTLVRAHPRDPDVRQSLAAACAAMGDEASARFHLERLADLDPSRAPMARVALGTILYNNGRLDAAAEAYRAAIARDPASPEAHEGLADALTGLGRPDEAEAALRDGLAALPDHPALAAAMGGALVALGRVPEALLLLERAVAAHPGHPAPASMLCHALNYVVVDADDPRTIRAARAYADALQTAITDRLPPPAPARDPERRLRVGLLSPDFRTHSVAFFLEPILEHRAPRDAFEIIAYSTNPAHDATTARLRAPLDGWRDAGALANEDLAALVRRDAVDVLVELSGHTTGHRLAAVSMRPAPVQLSYLGYPADTRLDAIDARIADSTTDPPGVSGGDPVIRLDPCFLAYRPPPEAPPPMLPEGPICFASFNVPAKWSPEALAMWAAVLRAIPGSRLLLKAAVASRPAARASLERSLGAAGIDPGRVEWLGWTPTIAEHLACYQRVHVALDTFPYHGTTTTCEALWMGVPVVTHAGSRHAGRVGASILAALNEAGLAPAASSDAFVRQAASLAGDPARLAGLRRSLRDRMLASPLLDHAGHSRRFWAAVRDQWRAACAGNPSDA
ncbi:MAG: tetratricopeptide repeat protein [Phycisphaerae bacterium]|nr:tetratricopeptide repeat protein [Phycisphaerae bacterium]